MYRATEYAPAYTPDAQTLEEFRPATNPEQSSLGAAAIRRHEEVLYTMYRHDMVAHPDDVDPRTIAATAAEGYVSREAYSHHAGHLDEIDTHYAPYLTESFYAKHTIAPDTPLSMIIRDATKTDEDGQFIMSRNHYVDLLKDMHAMHAEEVQKFAERLPIYQHDFVERLESFGLERHVDRFITRSDSVQVIYDDGFDTLARGGDGYTASHSSGNTRVVIAPNTEGEQKVVMHEYAHLMEGNGLKNAFADYPNLAICISEAIAEHLTTYLYYGGAIEDIDPYIPERATGVYDTYRHILNLFCNGGEAQLSVHQFIDATFNDDEQDAVALKAIIEQSFSKDPDLFRQLEGRLKRTREGENIYNETTEAQLVDFVGAVRERYEPLVQKASRVQKILQALSRLGRPARST
jgi:hypothetical protein